MVSTQWCFQLGHVRVTKGNVVILDDVSLTFLPGAKIGVVGPNGAGKSTVLKVIAGIEKPSAGEATAAPGVSIGSLLQVISAETQVLDQRALRADLNSRELALAINLFRALGGGFDVQVAMK